ncbi:MAG: hypothetical protein HUJ78_02400, partial [Mogibacterium sp.]|nr:hypothetical protein [Mogibacterium sp.]
MKGLIRAGLLIPKGIYAVMKTLPQKNQVTILSRQSDSPSLDICMLADKIREKHPDYEVVVLCRTLGSGLG